MTSLNDYPKDAKYSQHFPAKLGQILPGPQINMHPKEICHLHFCLSKKKYYSTSQQKSPLQADYTISASP